MLNLVEIVVFSARECEILLNWADFHDNLRKKSQILKHLPATFIDQNQSHPNSIPYR